MVDELELLRQDWQKQEQSLPRFSKEELYPMLLKKSSSLVRWILIVSMLEFGLWILLTFGIPLGGDDIANVESAIGQNFEIISTSIHLSALVFFMVWFYRNYRKIQSTDSPTVLMRNILNTRKTVKYYIWFNIIFFVIATFCAFALLEMNAPQTIGSSSLLVAIGSLLLFIAIAVGLLALFYKLLYGRLLKRLRANYQQLKKLEV